MKATAAATIGGMQRGQRWLWAVAVWSLLLSSSEAFAIGPTLPAVTLGTNPDGEATYSVSIQILLLMTALTLLPAALTMMTSFTRIIIVLAILRQALGLNQTPSNQVLIGLSLFLTVFVMGPVFQRIYEDTAQPYMNNQMTLQEALTSASQPVREFMIAQTRSTDLELFVNLRGQEPVAEPAQVGMSVLIPAFITSELKTAFQIGFLLFVPFLVIDLVVASVLMAMGMMMLSPMMISLPFKIMLFVLIDGWALTMSTLASSFLV